MVLYVRVKCNFTNRLILMWARAASRWKYRPGWQSPRQAWPCILLLLVAGTALACTSVFCVGVAYLRVRKHMYYLYEDIEVLDTQREGNIM